MTKTFSLLLSLSGVSAMLQYGKDSNEFLAGFIALMTGVIILAGVKDEERKYEGLTQKEQVFLSRIKDTVDKAITFWRSL